MFVCLSVCLSVRPFVLYLLLQISMKPDKSYMVGSVHVLSGFLNYIRKFSDQPSGRYCPETGHDWEKKDKNRRFFEVFVIIEGVRERVMATYCNPM